MSRRGSRATLIKEVFSQSGRNSHSSLSKSRLLHRSTTSLRASDEQDKESVLARIQQTVAALPLDQYGLTADDLAEICSFDNRNEPQQVTVLDRVYGGAMGIAYNLRCHPQDGLKRADLTDVNSYHYESFKKGTHGSQAMLNDTEFKSKQDLTVSSAVSMMAEDAVARENAFGRNVIPPPPTDSIFQMIVGQVKEDIILQVLLVGAIVVIALGTAICPSEGYIEGITILIAVIIVLAVTSGNDYSKDRKFKKLLLLQSDKKVRVIRGGHKDQISSWDLLVGDLIELCPGDEVPADGLFLHGTTIYIDESPLTGETHPAKKNDENPFLFSGCQVNEGSGYMIATGVGVRSSGGQIQELMNEQQNAVTVLQEKLKVVAVQIGKIGVAAGLATFFALAIRWAYNWATGSQDPLIKCGSANDNVVLARLQELAGHFVIGITVVVVAVPEGLPLAVTISLAFSMFKMMKDKCFVRHLDASETMGQATCICTDKTGTLTENRMTVVKIMIGTKEYNGEGSGDSDAEAYSPSTLPGKYVGQLLSEAVCINSTCFIKYNEGNPVPIFVGSATEGALLIMAEKLGYKYEQMRGDAKTFLESVWAFSSDRKRMSTLAVPAVSDCEGNTSPYRLYSKGASEVVLSLCEYMVSSGGDQVISMSSADKEAIGDRIKDYAGRGLRTLVLSYKDVSKKISTASEEDPETGLTFIGLVGIKDPVRKEVPDAVSACKTAGLRIKMVTGDNILTACKIAKECGILSEEGIAMEGPEFRALSYDEKCEIALKLEVLARSSPADKHTLVCLLQELGEVVAVTGDGTNDAPALKAADVGFAMGICGTQIAMNASDIVLMDDNFVSLVQSIRWGRNVLDSVRKFLQFQLGVNIVAIILTFVGACATGESPLNTVQLLWVNLIMDSLGALALASDDPDDDVLLKPPHQRKSSLLSMPMREYMGIQTVYQVSALLFLQLGLDVVYPIGSPKDVHGVTARAKTIVFCTFVFLQISNIIMCRKLDGSINVFKGFFKNKIFVSVVLIIIGVQVIVAFFGGEFLDTIQMTWQDWVITICISIGNLLFTTLVKLLIIAIRSGQSKKSAQTVTPEETQKIQEK